MTTRQVLRKARALLITKGWIQRIMHNDNGYCALGALQEVTRGDEHGLFIARRLAKNRLRKVIVEGGWLYDISSWNDNRCRTKDEVLRAFAKAAR